ncbi:hypothetical protein [Agromyces sp. NPDC049794]|uniref:hypothetical protein n=1 Tax=unclassified Agromyces TaxID=2639701 RepID=UPI0033E41091
MTLPDGNLVHGTTNVYGNHGCRCEACKEAHRRNHNDFMRRVRESGELAAPDKKHDTAYRYDLAC